MGAVIRDESGAVKGLENRSGARPAFELVERSFDFGFASAQERF
jgi:hypothetical protein